MSGFLKSIPLYAVLVEDVGERGAQYVAIDLARAASQSKQPARPSSPIPVLSTPSALVPATNWCSLAATVAVGAAIGFVLAKRF